MLDEAKKLIGSNGKFPLSSRLCYALPVSGLDSIAAVRVLMAMLWIRDTAPGHIANKIIEVDLADLRIAAGYKDSGSYRKVTEGLMDLWQAAFLLPSGDVLEIFDFVVVEDSSERKVCRFRLTEQFDLIHEQISEDGYGMVNIEEVLRLARGIDFPIYLRACAVRKRRKKVFDVTRSEIFCLSSRDPDEPMGGALRSVRTAISRVGAILRAEADVVAIDGSGRDRLKALRVSIAST